MDGPLPSPDQGALYSGARARIWHPGHAEHGMTGVVERVSSSGVVPRQGWVAGRYMLAGPMPPDRVVSEAEYQRRREADPRQSWHWPR